MRQKGSALLPIIIIIALIGVVGYLVYQNIQLKNGSVNPTPIVPNTVANLPEPSLTSDPTANWKTYYHKNLDISFKYPPDWTVQISSYIGESLDSCEYIIKSQSFSGYLKRAGACSDSTLKTFSPGLTVSSPDNVSLLQFAGPVEGLGGGCPDCTQNKPTIFMVNGRYYTLNTVASPPDIKFESLIGPERVGIPAGSKSEWNVFDVFVRAIDQKTFDTEIRILESIK
ncbi:MAG TPA: hypothetical protein VMR19_01750 [Candidatus Saccharimonadales bacterium]|jgi:hypothetical protein|nr:hypothetical protein [Candidatus Saccharimonadales bacterium]